MNMMKPDEESSLFKPIGDMELYPNKIDGENAYSFLYSIQPLGHEKFDYEYGFK